ncbi:alpha/beta hydrolase [Salinibius halmophilus]|uniref:alpha/beta hydrolase n=1 Tax=Salinibius halmophilus TaxID=1853216 RepID=UPI000E66525D|nr:alpha/beta hydrolase [Salinibius halmophilus]
MPVDEQLAPYIGLSDAPEITRLDPKAMRKTDKKYNRLSGPAADNVVIKDFAITSGGHELSGKHFIPDTIVGSKVLVFFHGGSFVVGLGGYHNLLSQLAEQAQLPILALDYSLSPEHVAPLALNECMAFMRWLSERISDWHPHCTELALAGDSAGGNICAHIAQRSNQVVQPISDCLLVYPYLDLTLSGDSHKTYAKGYGITLNSMKLAKAMYMEGSELMESDSRISPLFGEITPFHPRTYIALAEYDPMRSDGERYHRELLSQGVNTQLELYPGMIHSFWQMGLFLPQAQQLTRTLAEQLKAK